MEGKSKSEKQGFAPGTHTCPYHIWKPKGVSWGCTCSPAPAHQVNWEKALFDCGEGGVLCHPHIQPGVTRDRGFLSGIDRRHMATFYRTSAEKLLSAVRTARRGIAGRFLYVCEVVKSK